MLCDVMNGGDDFTRFEHAGWERVADKYNSVWSSLTRQFIPHLTRYPVPGQEYITICDPLEQPSLDHVTDKGLVFLFFPGNEQYRDLIREHYPRGMEGEMHNRGRAAGVLYVLSEAGSNSE